MVDAADGTLTQGVEQLQSGSEDGVLTLTLTLTLSLTLTRTLFLTLTLTLTLILTLTSEGGVLQWAWRPAGLRGEAVGDALSLVFRWVGPTREVVTASLELVLTLALTLTLTLTLTQP